MNVIALRNLPLSEYDQILPLIVGLLNCGGGTVEFNGSRSRQEVDDFEEKLFDEIVPQAPIFSCETEDATGEKMFVIEVPAGHEPPYAYKNVVFALENDLCHPATVEQIRDWVLGSTNGFNRWENRPCHCDEEDPIDRSALNESVREANKLRRVALDPKLPTKDILVSFSCCRYDRILNAGIVLFGKLPSRYAPQTQIRLTHFAGASNDSRIISTKTYDGPLTSSIDSVVNYITENSPQIHEFKKETGQRGGTNVYPPLAVREAVVNACAHRDYASVFGGVKISLFSNRLEVWNSGRLPKGVSVAALNRGEGVPSVLVNPTISGHLYVRGYMEQVGRGSSLMPKESSSVGTSVKWFSDPESGVRVVFKHKSIERDTKSPNVRKVLDIIADNPGLRKPVLEELTGLKRSLLQRILDLLRKEGQIVFHGSNRTGGYWITH